MVSCQAISTLFKRTFRAVIFGADAQNGLPQVQEYVYHSGLKQGHKKWSGGRCSKAG
jgi:hypothetical protein